MNRLILIGNGFDLAHGLKTSYNDFIFDYLKNICLEVINSPPISISQGIRNATIHYSGYYEDKLVRIGLRKNIPDLENHFEGKKTIKELINFLDEIVKNGYIEWEIKSSFLQKTVHNCLKYNWVDIENEYFDKLVQINNMLKTAREEKIISDIKEAIVVFNNEFQFLKDRLVEYLKKINSLIPDITLKSELNKIFTEEILAKEVLELDKNISPSSLYFLNFNYTNTLDKYLANLDEEVKFNVNYIHGKLENEINNPIIFGFGDEFDKKYIEFEDLKNNELFKHIKSFNYSLTSNYHNLIRFIEAKDFQVYVLGHSCGLSDRTMLNRIFEHRKCKSIKIFYYQKKEGIDDFTEKTYEISRHFSIKGDMRDKIVPKEHSRKMP